MTCHDELVAVNRVIVVGITPTQKLSMVKKVLLCEYEPAVTVLLILAIVMARRRKVAKTQR